MFVAQRPIKVIENGKAIHFGPGDKIPGFEFWPEVAKRAHLSLEWVVEIKDLPVGGMSSQPEVVQDSIPKKVSPKRKK